MIITGYNLGQKEAPPYFGKTCYADYFQSASYGPLSGLNYLANLFQFNFETHIFICNHNF